MNADFSISFTHIVALAVTLSLIIVLGIVSGRNVHSKDDFQTGGRNAGIILVTGAIISSLVGGSSTVGTAELAYNWGLSAWWFTIGSSLGAVLLGLVYAVPVRKCHRTTLQEIVADEYGITAGILTSILTSIGFLVNVVSQLLAAKALLTSILGVPGLFAVLLAAGIMTCYVIFGGMKSSGLLGLVKLILLYMATLGGGVLALHLAGGLENLTATLDPDTYLNFFARGAGKDLGSCISVTLGILSTQTYAQAILSGKDDRTATWGCLISGMLTLPIGILSIFIGVYMKLHFTSISPGQAFPLFILTQMPPILAGIILAGLLIVIVSTGAGMAFGFGTVITTDIYKRFLNKTAGDRTTLLVERFIILLVMVFGSALAILNADSPILNWGFLSMALRAVVLILPMTAALFLPGRINAFWATLSSILGLIAMGFCNLVSLRIEPLYVGLLTALLCFFIGYVVQQAQRCLNKKETKNTRL